MLDLKSLVPWGQKSDAPAAHEPRDVFTTFRREMDRLFDDVFGDFGSKAVATNGFSWGTAIPRLDVVENEKELKVSVELPGVDEKDIDVTLVGDLLTIKGEKKLEHEEKEGERHYIERRYGSFARTLRLPFEASDQSVEAEFDKGVLTIRIPKPAEMQSKVKHIEVRTH